MSGLGSEFPFRLRLFVDPGTVGGDESHVQRVDFYVSSLEHDSTAEELVSIATKGNGMRITKAQAREICTWLEAWLGGMPTLDDRSSAQIQSELDYAHKQLRAVADELRDWRRTGADEAIQRIGQIVGYYIATPGTHGEARQ